MHNQDTSSLRLEIAANFEHKIGGIQQVILHLNETGFPQEVVNCTRVSDEKVPLKEEKVVLDI